MGDRAVKSIDKCILILISGIIFMMPLYFNIFVDLNFQKAYFFRILTEILLAFYAAGILLRGNVRIRKNKFFYLSLLFLFLAQLAATVFSAHPYVSFWGSYVRQIGLFTWLHIYVFAFIVFNFLDKDRLSAGKIFPAMAVSGSIASIYALVQAGGFDFFVWDQARDGWQARPSSTFGQPNFLGTFLLFTLPVALYLLFTAKSFSKRCVFSILSVIQAAAIAVTYSRAAWLGLAASSVIFCLAYLWKKNKYVFSAFFAVLLVLSAVLSANIDNGKPASSSHQLTFSSRLKSAVNLEEGSAGMRRLYYGAAWEIIKSGFSTKFKTGLVAGHGLDTQYYHFYKYYDKDYPLFERINAYADRAHSELLDILITAGLAGFGAWLFLALGFLKNARSFLNSGADVRDKRILLALLFALLSVSVSVSLGFFTETDLVYFWVFVVFASIIFSKGEEAVFRFHIRKPLAAVFLLSFFLLLVSAAWNGNIKPEIADYHYGRAKLLRKYGDFNGSLLHFNSAIHNNPREIYYRNRFVIENLPVVLSIIDPRERLASLEYLKAALDERGDKYYNLESRAYSAILLSEIGRMKTDGGADAGTIPEFSGSEMIFKKMIGETPEMARIRLDYGTLLYYEKKYDESVFELESALSLYPSLDDPRMNAEHRAYVSQEMFLAYKRAMDVMMARKDYDKALSYADKAKRLYPADLELWDKISVIYSRTGRSDDLAPVFKHLRDLYPGNKSVLDRFESLSGNSIK